MHLVKKLFKELKNGSEISVAQVVFKLQIKTVKMLFWIDNSRIAWPIAYVIFEFLGLFTIYKMHIALVQGVRPFSVKISVLVCVVSHSILLSTKTARYSVIIWPSL